MGVERRTVQSVGITLDIIEYLREGGGAGVTEIAEALDRSKGTIHGLTLVWNELPRNGPSGRYS
jgi:DNA-binding IclR family transcriptional regulator